jgi:hypothetical protein
MTKLKPLVKGLITGIVMVAFNLYSIYKLPTNSNLAYLLYIIYAAGILWTLWDFSKSPQYTGKFQELFGQGFRCFIVVVIMMVVYAFIFTISHPEMKEEYGIYVREELVKQKNKTPAEIEKEVQQRKNQFTTVTVSRYLFGYLVPGAIFTAAGAAIFLVIRKKPWT